MKSSNTPCIRWLTGACAVAGLVMALPAASADDVAAAETADSGTADTATAEGATAVAGNLHFTDDEGNRRQPTAAEVRQAAEAFQRDLARLAGRHKDKPYVQTRPDGTVSATVGASKLVYLTVVDADGELRYGHTTMDEDGNVSFEPAESLPEK